MKNAAFIFLVLLSSNPFCSVFGQYQPDGLATISEKALLGQIPFASSSKERDGNHKVIPVVVHVIHNYGSENIPNTQIHEAIAALNSEFSATNYAISEIASAFRDIAADADIEFRLAQIDPYGNCTDGITRTVSPLTYAATDAVKELISWPRGKYLNIWVVRVIGLQNMGVVNHTVYQPGTATNATYDGILVRSSIVGTATSNSGLTYPVGIFLNLLPTWGSDFGQCGTDDGVADTPLTEGTYLCDTTQVTCGSLDNVQNFMDLSGCNLMFTEGQKTRMHTTLMTSIAGRDSLCTAENLIATGTNDGYTDVCVPHVAFTSDHRSVCEGDQVQFTDLSWNTSIVQWEWSFEGGTPATSTDQNPVVTYDNSGLYNASLTVYNSQNESAIYAATEYIAVSPYGEGAVATIVEGMEEATFPINSNAQLSWSIPESNEPTWERTTAAAVTGNASLKVDLDLVTRGAVAELVSPPLDFSWISGSNTVMTFKYAHAPRTGNSDEELRILVSRNCGISWSTRYVKLGLGLSTNGGANVTETFIPMAPEWKTDTVTLGSQVSGSPHVLIKFQATSGQQNALYLDDINIAQGALGIARSGSVVQSRIYPNPLTENSILELSVIDLRPVVLNVYDAVGRMVYQLDLAADAGLDHIPIGLLKQYLPSGIYFLNINTEDQVTCLKVVVG